MNPAKSKTIKKVLQRRLDDWAASLPDDLKKLANKHCIVTGGCIASLLTGEQINDIDVYFDDIHVAVKFAEYYNEEMGSPAEIRVVDYTNIKGEDEKLITNYVPSAGIAGDNPDEVDEAAEYENAPESDGETPRAPYSPVFISANAITLRNSIQLITRFTGTPDEVHEYFDFVHATNYYYKGELHLRKEALECLLSKTLIYRGSLYPVASIFRAHKFIKRGWRISAGEWLKIMWQISEIDLSDIEIMQDQLTGVDALYMRALINALSSVESRFIDSTYVITVIDRIFN